MIPLASMTTMASGTVSRMDCRCASRASRSRTASDAVRRAPDSVSPATAPPPPISASASKPTHCSSGSLNAWSHVAQIASEIAVAASPGHRPSETPIASVRALSRMTSGGKVGIAASTATAAKPKPHTAANRTFRAFRRVAASARARFASIRFHWVRWQHTHFANGRHPGRCRCGGRRFSNASKCGRQPRDTSQISNLIGINWNRCDVTLAFTPRACSSVQASKHHITTKSRAGWERRRPKSSGRGRVRANSHSITGRF